MTRLRMLTFGLMTALLASGYGVMFTVLDDFRNEYGITASWLGTIVGVGFLASFLAQIVLAPIADRGLAKAMVLLGLGLNVIGMLGMALGETVGVLLMARFMMGIGVGAATPAVRRIVINADPENLGQNVGMLLAADIAGFAVGPAVSAVLVPWFGIPAQFLLIAALTVAAFPIVLRLPVAEAVIDRSTGAGAEPRWAFDLLRSRPLVAGLMLGSAIFMMIGTFDALWAIVLDDIGAAEWIANVGIIVFATPLVLLGTYSGRLAQRVGPFLLAPVGLALGAGFVFLYGLMPTGAAMLTVGVIHSLCDGFTVSSTAVAVGMVAPPQRQASAQGMLGAAETLTAGVTSVMAGVLYDAGGRLLAFSVAAATMLLLVGSATVLAGSRARSMRGTVTLSPVASGEGAIA